MSFIETRSDLLQDLGSFETNADCSKNTDSSSESPPKKRPKSHDGISFNNIDEKKCPENLPENTEEGDQIEEKTEEKTEEKVEEEIENTEEVAENAEENFLLEIEDARGWKW